MTTATRKQLLTHSRQDAFKTCRRRHWFSYELGMRPALDAKALRMGTAFHAAQEQLGAGNGLEGALSAARACYAETPDGIDAESWDLELEIVVRLICGYDWRWQNDGLEYVAAEQVFEIPLINPETGSPSTIFSLAGKIDGIVRLPDGRLAVKEIKTTSDSIDTDSTLWKRLRIDHQISLYVLAARRLGYAVDCVLYDVTHKPGIKPRMLKPAEKKAFASLGEWANERFEPVIIERETVGMFGARLNCDIAERPEFYFQRVEVPRLDQDLAEYEAELWDIQLTIREAQRSGRWYRTVGKDVCGYCPYFGPCTSGWQPTDSLPEGFVIIQNLHPELGERHEQRATESATA